MSFLCLLALVRAATPADGYQPMVSRIGELSQSPNNLTGGYQRP